MFLSCLEEWDKLILQKDAFQEVKIIKSPAISPPRKYPIPNQDIKRLLTKQDTSLPLIIKNYPSVYKPLLNYTHYSNST